MIKDLNIHQLLQYCYYLYQLQCYSLSFFNNNNSTLVANIKVNDLLFNITTNSDESDDRILRLQTGKTESFYVKLKNLNSINAKYELKY